MQNDFDECYNISHYDKNLEKPSNNLIFEHYICSCIVYSILTGIIVLNSYYQNMVWGTIGHYILYAFFAYIVFAPVFLFTIKPKSVYASNSIEVVNYFKNIFKNIKSTRLSSCNEILAVLTPTYRQQQAISVYLVKLFFAPLILSFMFSHVQEIAFRYIGIKESFILLASNNFDFSKILNFNSFYYVYLFFMALFFFIDCAVFSVGYWTELECLKNKIRSVDTTVTGILFCIACYPPFNYTVYKFIQWQHLDIQLNNFNQNGLIVYLYGILCLALVFIYVSASVALGFKASNLTNRGTVDKFPYNIVRHPAYASKVSWWWVCSIIPMYYLFIKADFSHLFLYILAAVSWTFIYYMRAITEERHLSKDPEYLDYVKRVKYRFIPFIW